MSDFYKVIKNIYADYDQANDKDGFKWTISIIHELAKTASKNNDINLENLFLLLTVIISHDEAIKDAVIMLDSIAKSVLLSKVIHQVEYNEATAKNLKDFIFQIFPAEEAILVSKSVEKNHPDIWS